MDGGQIKARSPWGKASELEVLGCRSLARVQGGGHLGFWSAGSLPSAPDSRDRNRKFGRIRFPESVTMKFSFQRTTYSKMSAALSGEYLGHDRVGQRNETKPCHGSMARDAPRVGSAQRELKGEIRIHKHPCH